MSRKCWQWRAQKVVSERVPLLVCSYPFLQFCYAQRATYHCILVNLAFALALRRNDEGRRLCVGILDLDIFGPSIPTLMGLQNNPEPSLTPGKFFSPSFPVDE